MKTLWTNFLVDLISFKNAGPFYLGQLGVGEWDTFSHHCLVKWKLRPVSLSLLLPSWDSWSQFPWLQRPGVPCIYYLERILLSQDDCWPSGLYYICGKNLLIWIWWAIMDLEFRINNLILDTFAEIYLLNFKNYNYFYYLNNWVNWMLILTVSIINWINRLSLSR